MYKDDNGNFPDLEKELMKLAQDSRASAVYFTNRQVEPNKAKELQNAKKH